MRGGGRVNNQSKQKQVGGGEEKRGERKCATEEVKSTLPVDEPVVEEGPVEPEAHEVTLVEK